MHGKRLTNGPEVLLVVFTLSLLLLMLLVLVLSVLLRLVRACVGSRLDLRPDLRRLRVVRVVRREERRVQRRHWAVLAEHHRWMEVSREQVMFLLREQRRVEEVHREVPTCARPVRVPCAARQQRGVQRPKCMWALHHRLVLRQERRVPEIVRMAICARTVSVVRPVVCTNRAACVVRWI